MLNLIEPTRGLPTSAALRTLPFGRRAIRSSADERPEDDDEIAEGLEAFPPPKRSRLPRVLEDVRVLVVDDHEDTLELFAVALTACGAVVLTASSASEALRVIVARNPDVVVSDIAMPGADGYWLLREIRQLPDPRARIVPVLAVTAFGREHVRARALAAGFVDYLEKPVDPEALCVTVARARQR